jgi:hypothetical protein
MYVLELYELPFELSDIPSTDLSWCRHIRDLYATCPHHLFMYNDEGNACMWFCTFHVNS